MQIIFSSADERFFLKKITKKLKRDYLKRGLKEISIFFLERPRQKRVEQKDPLGAI